MTSKIRPFFWLLALLAILACSTFTQTVRPKSLSTSTIKYFSGKSTLIPPTTNTPTPSTTFTPTESLPSLTPSLVSTSTSTPTVIPVESQLSIFENLWAIVNDTYIYPDFNGLDWNAIHQEYRQIIASGLTNDQFYLAMSDVITRLGDDHSLYLDPQAGA